MEEIGFRRMTTDKPEVDRHVHYSLPLFLDAALCYISRLITNTLEILFIWNQHQTYSLSICFIQWALLFDLSQLHVHLFADHSHGISSWKAFLGVRVLLRCLSAIN